MAIKGIYNILNETTGQYEEYDLRTSVDQVVGLEVTLDNKLDKQQGLENAGKNLVVGEDGNVILGDGGGHVIVPAIPSPAEAKDKVVYFVIENGKAKGYIKNGDVMVEIGKTADGIPIGTIVSYSGDLSNIPEGLLNER